MRLFIAVPLPEHIASPIAARMQNLARAVESGGSKVTWVKAPQLHFTLKFLGDCTAEQVTALAAGLHRAAGEAKPFALCLGNLGCFPERGKPGIIWLGIKEGAAELIQLAANIEELMEPLGFPRDPRGFHPHLTLGRTKFVRRADTLRGLLAALPGERNTTWTVEAIVLIKSQLSSQGPDYTILETARLGEQ